MLEKVATESGLELVPDPGGAAYYGPKISVQARDAIGRTWQMSTIQYDFNQPSPERFELEYQAADGTRQQPVMIHSAKFGSIERFIGVLVEHYAGAFPPWLAPVQVQAIPIAERHNDYLYEVAARLKKHGIRVEVDESDDRMQKKIRNAQLQKVPFMLIAGDNDLEAGAVSFRYRDGHQENGVSVEDAIARVVEAVQSRARSMRCSLHASQDPDATSQDGVGEADDLDRLWTPHRMAYIKGENKPTDASSGECPFCRIPTLTDAEGLVVHRGEATFVVLNLYPYSPGHVMVCPYRHVADYPELDEAETAEVAAFTKTAMRTIGGSAGRTASTSA